MSQENETEQARAAGTGIQVIARAGLILRPPAALNRHGVPWPDACLSSRRGVHVVIYKWSQS